jgi:hypothetical protein
MEKVHTQLEVTKLGDVNSVFRCQCCKSQASAVSKIEHTKDCSVTNPDTVDLPFDSKTNSEIRSIIQEAMLAHTQLHCTEVYSDYNPEPKQKVKEQAGVNWVTQGSTSRFVVSLGKTNTDGEFRQNGADGLVLKISPYVRFGNTTPDNNLREIQCWNTANEIGSTDLFCNIRACAKDGAWLVMDECLPVYPRQTLDSVSNRDYLVRPDGVLSHVSEVKNAGWSCPDYKHGNIGLDSTNSLVLIDYGTGVSYNKQANTN